MTIHRMVTDRYMITMAGGEDVLHFHVSDAVVLINRDGGGIPRLIVWFRGDARYEMSYRTTADRDSDTTELLAAMMEWDRRHVHGQIEVSGEVDVS